MGLPIEVTHWIMSYVTTTSFVVLINGSTSNYFKRSHGIRQGCCLSPYLFLLVIEGFSKLLLQEKENKLIKGIKVSGSIYLTHTLFVDDVMIFGMGDIYEWTHIKALVDILCGASGMPISSHKACISYSSFE